MLQDFGASSLNFTMANYTDFQSCFWGGAWAQTKTPQSSRAGAALTGREIINQPIPRPAKKTSQEQTDNMQAISGFLCQIGLLATEPARQRIREKKSLGTFDRKIHRRCV
ncbi:MAG: hypothetical protein DMG37_24055 [Acidobacteria bacterium]|nr:MAG: hypothetical protein DMG37_24055 [Acidobacteriota bacterium]